MRARNGISAAERQSMELEERLFLDYQSVTLFELMANSERLPEYLNEREKLRRQIIRFFKDGNLRMLHMMWMVVDDRPHMVAWRTR